MSSNAGGVSNFLFMNQHEQEKLYRSMMFDMTVQKALYELLHTCADWADESQMDEFLDEINRLEGRIREKKRRLDGK